MALIFLASERVPDSKFQHFTSLDIPGCRFVTIGKEKATNSLLSLLVFTVSLPPPDWMPFLLAA
jgi:hypothetical protein